MSRTHRYVLIAGLFAVTLLGFKALPLDDDFFAIRKNFQIYGKLYEHVVTGYVNPVDPNILMRTGIEAMLNDLDPYTTFFDEGDVVDIRMQVQGNVGTVGLNLTKRNEQLTVSSPDEGASGFRQGVRAGDIIIAIDGRPTDSLSVSDAQRLLAGEPGTGVEISVSREGLLEPLGFFLNREEPTLQNVSYQGLVADNRLAYIRLDQFGRGAGEEVRQAVTNLLEEGTELEGLILDLRNNGGGLLEAAVTISGLFVPQDTRIVSMRGRQPQSYRIYNSEQAPLAPDLPLVVLVNEESASASEIVAGAMQDLDRGVVLGETTFGKGIVQVVMPMPFNTSLKITTAKYYIPSGRSIQSFAVQQAGTRAHRQVEVSRNFSTAAGRTVRDGHGIEPDQRVSLPPSSPLEEALIRRGAFFFFANAYAAENPDISSDFEVDDAVFAAFRSWLDEEEFTYETGAERTSALLAEELEDLQYTSAGNAIASLHRAILEEKNQDFDRHRERLATQLRSEILARYFGQTAQIEASFSHDIQFQAAVQLLFDARAYRAILQPS